VPWAGPILDEQLESAWRLLDSSESGRVTTAEIVEVLQSMAGGDADADAGGGGREKRPLQVAHELKEADEAGELTKEVCVQPAPLRGSAASIAWLRWLHLCLTAVTAWTSLVGIFPVRGLVDAPPRRAHVTPPPSLPY